MGEENSGHKREMTGSTENRFQVGRGATIGDIRGRGEGQECLYFPSSSEVHRVRVASSLGMRGTVSVRADSGGKRGHLAS